jgi:hypothetical protein
MTHRSRCLLALVVSACGGDGRAAQDLDCAWIASEQNCWWSMLAEAAACTAPTSSIGVFDANGGTCSYDDGWLVEFDPPYPYPKSYTLTVSRAGTRCIRYTNREVAGGVELEIEVGDQRITASGSQDGTYSLTCPDGDRYATHDLFSILTCAERPYGIPGVLRSSSTGSVVGVGIPFGEDASGLDIEVQLFRCSPAPARATPSADGSRGLPLGLPDLQLVDTWIAQGRRADRGARLPAARARRAMLRPPWPTSSPSIPPTGPRCARSHTARSTTPSITSRR